MKKFSMPIVVTVSLIISVAEFLPEFPVETGIRQECGGDHRQTLDTNVLRRRGAPFDV